MPKIFEYFGFVFFFYSNEHEPIHVHVMRGDRQTVFEIFLEDGELKLLKRRNVTGASPLSSRESNIAAELIEVYALQIVDKWIDFFILKKPVSCTEVRNKIDQ